jgi:hypothetical protein
MPQKAILAFRKLGHRRVYALDDTTLNGWRTLSDGTMLPFFPDRASPARFTSIFFSRVFFEPGGHEAYVYERANWCDISCSGSGIFWHAVRADSGSWTFLPTKCTDVS